MLRLSTARGKDGIIIVPTIALAGSPGTDILSSSGHRGGAARMHDGRLAGSVISMLDAVRIMVEQVGTSVGEAALMASTNPARVLGLGDRSKIEAGQLRDLLVLGPGLELKTVIIGGRELT